MRRTLVQLDEATFQRLRQRAFREARSLSAVVRDLLGKALTDRAADKPARPRRLLSVRAGRSRQGTAAPVSERHDAALADLTDT